MATHWGYYWSKKNHIKRILSSGLTRIDSFLLYSNDQKRGFKVPELDLEAEAHNTHLKLRYGKSSKQIVLIQVEHQKCQYGGYRAFFRCGLCNNRVRFLYLGQKRLFLCSKCWNIAYKVQNLRPSQRYDYMAQKIKDKLKISKYESFARRPKGMHIKTYEKLQDQLFEYERKYNNAFNKEMIMWHGEKMRPFLESDY